MRRFALALLALVLVLTAAPSLVLAQDVTTQATLPAGFSEATLASGLASPTAMALAPDGRIFVAEQPGRIRVVKNGALLPAPFVDLTANVSSIGERGMLGVAIDPKFATTGYVYVYYTAKTPQIHNRVSRFTASGDIAAAGSELVLLDLPPLGATNHNGGAIHVGRDGKLYIGVGDNAVGSNAQSLATPLGKLLRINRNGTIPNTNPFYGQTTGISRAIWAYGLRNPFTFAIQPGSGKIYINDVGASSWEEINPGLAGANYGWPNSEGEAVGPGETAPLFAYGHGSTRATGCAIAGGAFYNPAVQQFPNGFRGDYLFADYCSGWIRRYRPASDRAIGFITGVTQPVDLLVAPDGSLYYLAQGSGATTGVLVRVTYGG